MHACWPTIRTDLLPFGEIWFAGVTAAALLSELPTELGAVDELASDSTDGDSELGDVARWAFGIGGGGVVKAVWWDLRLASLLDALVIPPIGSMGDT